MIKNSLLHLRLLAPVALLMLAGCSSARPADFGKRWVRAHPYTLMGLCLNDEPHDIPEYVGAGFEHMLAWRPWRVGVMQPTADYGLTWFGNIPWVTSDPTRAGLKRDPTALVSGLSAKYPGNVGWLVNDEPTPEELPATARIMEWIRTTHPESLVFSNLGGDPNYAQHARNFMDVLKPDVMMYDAYPFDSIKGTWNQANRDKWFRCAATVRDVALKAKVPYWAFVHSIDRSREHRRLSESNLRMQLFVYLTYGYTGQAYFIYDWGFKNAPGLLNIHRKPSHVYGYAAGANREVANIGKVVRFLNSTHVFAVFAGKGVKPFVDPKVLPIRTSQVLTNDPLRRVDIIEGGAGKHGLIGYFKDDTGQRYFMVTNLWRRPGEIEGSSANTTLSFRIVLDPSINSIWRLNRKTGKPERLEIANSAEGLVISLPGGTGDLFKINNGRFPGL